MTKFKHFKFVLIVLIVLIISSIFFSCNKSSHPNSDEDIIYGDPGTNIRCAVFCDNDIREFDIENVVVTVCFGLEGLESIFITPSTTAIRFVNKNNDEYIIREFDGLFSEDFKCSAISGKKKEYIYNHSEQIKIPAFLFNEDFGIVVFSIDFVTISGYREGNMCEIYYAKIDDKIIIGDIENNVFS